MEKKRPEMRGSDAIDRFAAEILQHPEEADALKARLRQSLGVAAANRRTLRLAPEPTSSRTPEPEDFWDNVPV